MGWFGKGHKQLGRIVKGQVVFGRVKTDKERDILKALFYHWDIYKAENVYKYRTIVSNDKKKYINDKK